MSVLSRYIVEKLPNQEQTALQGIAHVCTSIGIGQVTLVVPQKGRWANSTFAQVVGVSAAKALGKGEIVKLGGVANLTLESVQTFRGGRGLLVGVHIPIRNMNRLDDSWEAQAIMYLPWNDEEGQEWWATWKPQTIGPSVQRPAAGNLAAVVEEALLRLTRSINLGSGLNHPSDKEHAERVVSRLRAEGQLLDPEEVRRWAQRHAWSSNAASELEAIVRKRQ